MDSLRLILRSLVHYRRLHAGLFVGTALAATILAGALAVGDSADHTLRTFALQRLGDIRALVTSGDRLVARGLADDVSRRLGAPAEPVLLMPGMALRQAATGGTRQINRVQVVGITDGFRDLGGRGIPALRAGEVALNDRLAAALGAVPGDSIALRVAAPSLLPAQG